MRVNHIDETGVTLDEAGEKSTTTVACEACGEQVYLYVRPSGYAWLLVYGVHNQPEPRPYCRFSGMAAYTIGGEPSMRWRRRP